MRGSAWATVILLALIVQGSLLDNPRPEHVGTYSRHATGTPFWHATERWQFAGNTACNPRAQICDRVDDGPQR